MKRIASGLATLLLVACSGAEQPAASLSEPVVEAGPPETSPIVYETGISEAAPVDTAVDCKVAQDDGTICSCTEVGQNPPTLYLVLDRSGSMADQGPGTTSTKWKMIRDALVGDAGVLRKLGSRVKIAVSWFPSPSFDDVCNSGREVVPPTVGGQGTYDDLQALLASAIPRGATPTAATLQVVGAAIAKMDGPVHVLLATDGAPNCGTKTCTADACTYNLEHQKIFGDSTCDATINCCDPGMVSSGLGWRACSDDAATANAAAAIAAKGSKFFVLGVPGTIDAYRAHLDTIAVAGGTVNDGPTKYWAPTDDASLVTALSAIAARAIDSCEVRLAKPVDDPGVTNVLLDGAPIPADGWKWTSPSTIELLGAACDSVHGGTVSHVSVAVGCRTVTR
ncbi:MAG: hypothetical protein ACXWP4_04720 [Polyangiales bacterium]